MRLICCDYRVTFNSIMLNHSSLSSDEKIVLINLEQESWPSEILMGLQYVLPSCLQVNYCDQDLLLIVA